MAKKDLYEFINIAMTAKKYKPALRYSILNTFYDYLALWAFRNTSLNKVIKTVIQELHLEKNKKILELGCGPARLALWIKQLEPACRLTALDGDPVMLEIARHNAKKAGLSIDFIRQDMTKMNLKGPYDCIYSTLVFHHLATKDKSFILKNIAKLLKPKGLFVLADFCGAKSISDRIRFFVTVQMVDGFETTTDHAAGWLEKNLHRHFKQVRKPLDLSTFLGPIGVFVCRN